MEDLKTLLLFHPSLLTLYGYVDRRMANIGFLCVVHIRNGGSRHIVCLREFANFNSDSKVYTNIKYCTSLELVSTFRYVVAAEKAPRRLSCVLSKGRQFLCPVRYLQAWRSE